MKMKHIVPAISILIVVLLLFGLSGREITHPPGILVDEEPEQVKIAKGEKTWERDGYRITALAAFHLRARVLGVKKYRFGRESDLSPFDLALGWGPMSAQENIDEIDISQSGRWYHWRSREMPIPRRAIERNSANMHMIPADEDVEDALGDVKRGHLIELSGYLIAVKADDGWKWRSSLSRNDTGDRSCEVVWVENFSILN